MLAATDWCPADYGCFRGGGFSSRFVTEAEMPVTMMRLNLVRGLGPVVQIAEGWTVCLPEDVSDILWRRTDYTWPCTWFAPRLTGQGAFRSAYDVMNNWGANHGAIMLRPYRRGPDHAVRDAAHPRVSCTTSPRSRFSVPRPGTPSAWIGRAPITGLARHMGRCTVDRPRRERKMDREGYLKRIDEVIAAGRYKADWDTMAGREMPAWMYGGKLGIFIHWGVFFRPRVPKRVVFPQYVYKRHAGV
jgi:hypothetical protein